jgi:hypothetical protein
LPRLLGVLSLLFIENEAVITELFVFFYESYNGKDGSIYGTLFGSWLPLLIS